MELMRCVGTCSPPDRHGARGASATMCAASSKIVGAGRLCLRPTSRSFGSWAGVTFTAPAGTMTALVGPSETIANLPKTQRRAVVLGMFVYAGLAILLALGALIGACLMAGR